MKFGVTHHYRVGKVLSSPALQFHMQPAAESHHLLLHIFILRKICSCSQLMGMAHAWARSHAGRHQTSLHPVPLTSTPGWELSSRVWTRPWPYIGLLRAVTSWAQWLQGNKSAQASAWCHRLNWREVELPLQTKLWRVKPPQSCFTHIYCCWARRQFCQSNWV